VQEHDPAIFVVVETKLGDERAKVITKNLLMDGAIHTETIGYSGGLWLLWNSNKVEVESLAKTEQKIHVEIKARSSNLAWIFFAIYASPRSEERCILWENLAKVVELIVKSKSEQRSRCVALRRQQIRRRCHITLKFESRKFEVDVKYILAFCGSCN